MIDRNPSKKPFFCPVCKSPMSSSTEIESYDRISACSLCETYIYYPKREMWESGWRPSVEEARAYLSARGVPLLAQLEKDG